MVCRGDRGASGSLAARSRGNASAIVGRRSATGQTSEPKQTPAHDRATRLRRARYPSCSCRPPNAATPRRSSPLVRNTRPATVCPGTTWRRSDGGGGQRNRDWWRRNSTWRRRISTASAFPRTRVEAVGWYRKAAEQGDAIGQLRLGELYGEDDTLPLNARRGSPLVAEVSGAGQRPRAELSRAGFSRR